MARSLEQIKSDAKLRANKSGSKPSKELRNEAASLFVKYAEKYSLPFIGAESKEYNKSLIQSRGTEADCLHYISKVEVFLETVNTADKPWSEVSEDEAYERAMKRSNKERYGVEHLPEGNINQEFIDEQKGTVKTVKAVEPAKEVATVEPVKEVEPAKEVVKAVETVKEVETVKAVEPAKVSTADDVPDYSNSDQEKIAIAKQLYYSKAKEHELTGLREYHLMITQQDKFFLADFAILVARARVIIEEYAHSKSREGKAHPGSIQKIRLEIVKFIEPFVKADNAGFDHPKGITLLETYQAFDDAIRGAFKDIGKEKHLLNQRMNRAGEIDVRAIKVLSFIEWAIETVNNLPALPSNNKLEDRRNGAKWKEIAIAVMLLTGRRQSEVLSSGKFSYVDESTVKFEGQLKRHVEELVDAEEIPVLGKAANQVVDAIEWLGAYQKRTIPQERNPKAIQEAAKKSHDKCSRYIAEAMETLSKFCPITNNKEWVVTEGGKTANKFKGHLCRQIYAQVCEGLFNDPNETKKRAYINKILLESSNASVPYDRDVNVVDTNEVIALCGKV